MIYSPSLGIWVPPKRGIVDIVKERLANLAGLVNGGMINAGHAMVNGGIIRAHTAQSALAAFITAGWEGSVTDITGRGNNLTKVTGTATTATGPSNMGNLLTFDNNTYYSAPSTADLQLAEGGTWFILQWYKSSLAAQVAYAFSKGGENLGLAGSEYGCIVLETTPKIYLRVEFDNTTNNRDMTIPSASSDGVWHLNMYGCDNVTTFISRDGAAKSTPQATSNLGFAGSNTFYLGGTGVPSFRLTGSQAFYLGQGAIPTDAQLAAIWNSGAGVPFPWAGVP